MTRVPLNIVCQGDTLAATLDAAPGASGLLIVSGGNEIRSGAWSNQAQLAARLAAAGHPVLRFDRRGVGDSEGANRGYRRSQADIAAALAAFRAAVPSLRRFVGFGNCDAASALMLFGAEVGLHALLLANPWTVDGDENEDIQAPAALRRRYAAKLADPAEWMRLLRGGIDLRKLAGGLRQAAAPARPSTLAGEMRDALARFAGPATILLAERDRTAELFLDAWGRDDPRIVRCATASHSFSDEAAREWLYAKVSETLQAA